MSTPKPAFPFESLEVYQRARAFRQRIYRLATLLPDSERFNLASQMRAAARSLTNNIAEACGRYTFRDRARFLHQARGSLTELMDDIVVCEDEAYAQGDHLATLRPDAVRLYQAISGYVRFLRNQAGQNDRATRGRAPMERVAARRPSSNDARSPQ